MQKSVAPYLFLAALAGGLLPSAASAGITVDGNLNDWGINVKDNNQTTYNVPNNIGVIATFKEDQDDNAGSGGYLGPHSGGQDYDAEFLGVAKNGNTLSIAVLTGQRPDNGFSKFAPGDIQIFGTQNGQSVVFGIEVGGGSGGGSGTAITEGAAGTTYNTNSSGATTSIATTPAAQVAGSIWKDVTWLNNPLNPQGPVQFVINGNSVYGGLADYVYTRNSFTTQHAVIELAIDLSTPFWNNVSLNSIQWLPACGNDVVSVNLPPMPSVNPIPEPSSVALWSLGAVGCLVGRRLRRRRA